MCVCVCVCVCLCLCVCVFVCLCIRNSYLSPSYVLNAFSRHPIIHFSFIFLGVVDMHVETLVAVNRESKRLPPVQKVGFVGHEEICGATKQKRSLGCTCVAAEMCNLPHLCISRLHTSAADYVHPSDRFCLVAPWLCHFEPQTKN